MAAKISTTGPVKRSAVSRLSVTYVSTVVIISVLVLLAGINPQRIYAYDSFILFDGSWRIEQGYVPYKDFYMLIGPLSLLIMAGSMIVTHDSPMAEPISVVLSLIPLSIAVWAVVRKRYLAPVAYLIFLYLCLLWASSFPIHYLFYKTSYAMFENRQGYVFISLILLLLFPTTYIGQPRMSFFTCMGVGLLIALILFEKANYALSAVLLVTGILNRKIIPCIPGIVIGFLIGLAPFAFYLGLEGMTKMYYALENAAALRSPLLYLGGVYLILVEIPLLTLFLAIIGQALLPKSDYRLSSSKSTALFIETILDSTYYQLAVLILVSCSLELGGYPMFEIIDVPLLSVYAFTLLSQLLERDLIRMDLSKNSLATVCLGPLIIGPLLNLSLGLIFPFYSLTIDSIQHHVTLESKWCPLTVFDEPEGLENLPEHNEGVLINDGLRLIRKHPELDNQRIATFYFTDAFSYSLHRKSPPHMPSFLHIGTNISAAHCPAPDYILTDCGAVMVCTTPQTSEFDIVQGIPQYAAYLNANYVLTDQSQSWALWVHK